MDILVNDIINKDAYNKVVDILVDYNLSKITLLPSTVNKPIEILIKRNTDIIGGLYGRSFWGTLEIKTFAVYLKHRGFGLGQKLIQAVEKEAKSKSVSISV